MAVRHAMRNDWTRCCARVCCAWPKPARAGAADRPSQRGNPPMPATDINVMAPAGGLPLPPSLPPIEGPSAWIGADMRAREAEWSYRLSSPQVAEIDAAVKAVRARGLDIADIRRA